MAARTEQSHRAAFRQTERANSLKTNLKNFTRLANPVATTEIRGTTAERQPWYGRSNLWNVLVLALV
jgi:hypothetical protein